ncbi:MAG: hypothetical protein IKQ72_01605 [Bacteroidaceae bacterium]|nr:hypothetical protein [Bacteroidaceae bacterium]
MSIITVFLTIMSTCPIVLFVLFKAIVSTSVISIERYILSHLTYIDASIHSHLEEGANSDTPAAALEA